MWWRTLHSGLWYIIVVLCRHTNTLQTHTNKQTPTHTMLAQPLAGSQVCLLPLVSTMCSRVPALPPHVNISFIGIRPRWDQNLEFCIFAPGNIQLLTIWVVQIRTDFPLNLGYVVAMCALPEYPFLLPNFPRNDMLCIFLLLSPSYHCETNFFPGKGGWVGAQHTLPPRCDSY